MDEQRPNVLLEKLINEIRKSYSIQSDYEYKSSEKYDEKAKESSCVQTDNGTECPWNQLIEDLFIRQEGKVPVLKDDWNGFAKGTDRKVIDDWFSRNYNKSISNRRWPLH